MNEKEEVMYVNANCDQCGGAPTITAVRSGDGLQGLCLRCWKEFSSIMSDQFERNVRALNHEAALMDHMSGMPFGFTPRYQLPSPRHQTIIGEYKLTNIKIERSAVGVINTGTIAGSLENIDATIQIVKGNSALQGIHDGMKKISEAVMNATDASQSQKEEMLELISALADEVRASEAKRRPSAIKSILKSISEAAGMVASIAQAWDFVRPLFESLIR